MYYTYVDKKPTAKNSDLIKIRMYGISDMEKLNLDYIYIYKDDIFFGRIVKGGSGYIWIPKEGRISDIDVNGRTKKKTGNKTNGFGFPIENGNWPKLK